MEEQRTDKHSASISSLSALENSLYHGKDWGEWEVEYAEVEGPVGHSDCFDLKGRVEKQKWDLGFLDSFKTPSCDTGHLASGAGNWIFRIEFL